MAQIKRETIQEIVFLSIEAFNKSQETENQIVLDEETALLGQNAPIDSMALVSLLIEIEQQLQEQLNVSISFTSDKAMSIKGSPFRRIRTLIEFIHKEIAAL